ncbi:MAG TPA: SRPBCC family protein [Gaiellaceae bacterium]|nr:SRPBCC family protein [Gaiellaceae bacterium]
MRLENGFEVDASPDRAWALLNDVPRVIPCMPGAELVETVDENTWKGRVHVKLGPVALQFDTDVVREAEDAAARRVVLTAKARELRGRGSAQARIESSLSAVDGRTRVAIETELTLQGTVAQYGRGIVPDVAAQLTREFAANLAALLDADHAAAPAAGDEAPPRAAAVAPISGFRLALRVLRTRLARLLRRG